MQCISQLNSKIANTERKLTMWEIIDVCAAAWRNPVTSSNTKAMLQHNDQSGDNALTNG